MKNHSGGLLGDKLPFYQKVLNMTLGISVQSSASTRKAEEPLAPSPFRRGYTRAAASAVGRPGIPVTPIHVVTTTPGHPAHMGTGGGTTTTPVTPSTPTKHGSTSTAASIFRSFRRRSLRRSFRRTKSFLVKTPTPATPTPTPTITSIATDSFVNSQEWTLSRAVPDLRLGIVGSLASGKSALVHRYLTGSYMQEESPEGGRFKKEISIDGQSYLLLIRDEGGSPELQFTAWVDAVIFVFSLESEASFNAIYSYHAKMAQFRNASEIPFILVGTQDGINETNPRVVDEARARKLASDLRRCSYYETCATYGLNIERVFQDACQKIVQQRLTPLAPPSAGVVSGAAAQRPTTPNHYSLGRHYSQQQQQQQQHSTGSTTSITTGGGSSGPAASHGGYPGAVSGFSSSSLGSVVAGSTLGPAGAGSIGTGHSSLAGYSSNNVGGSALSGSALNLHSSASTAASLSTNGALAARAAMPPPPPHGTYVNHYANPKTGAAVAAGSSATPRRTNSNHNVTGNNSSTTSSGNSSTSNNSNNAAAAAVTANNTVVSTGSTSSSSVAPPAEKHLNAMGPTSQSSQSGNALGSAESLALLRSTPPSTIDTLSVPGKDKDGKDLPTPSSTPTTSRKSRRRSNLFTPSSSKKEDKEKSDKDKAKNSNGGGELGSGRAIPIKQGYLYKRSHNALNKDWKKKYVTLGDDGKLTYHSSLHDYMDDSHGKEISLQYVTVKVPGQKPRGSRGTQLQQQQPMAAVTSTPGVVPGANGVMNEPITGFPGGKDKRTEKTTVMLTAYEVLKEPVTRILMGGGNGGGGGGDDPSSQNAINGGIADSSAKTETPSVKKRHRRMKSSSNKANDLDDCDGYEFQIVSLDNKIWHFEAASVEEREEWVTSIEHQILSSLQGNESSKSKSRMNSLVDAASIQSLRSTVIGNANCADCDAPNPDWASLNLGVLVCIECSGIHRNLGSHISRVRSLDLDEWPPGHIAVMLGLGNTLSNSIWEARMRGVKPGPQSSRDDKERWIRAKYEHKEFLALPSSSGSLGQQLIDAVCRSDLKTVALLLARAGPEDVNCSVAVRDLRTPLHLAATLGNLALVQLLLWHNANVKALDQEGRTCLTFARVSNSPEVIELLIANGCPEGPSSISSFSTLNRRKTINLTSTTNLMGKAEQGL
ncbi:centaurin-gamma-1A-like isoform X1 [Daphnia pulex]|uniref:centaurin-gamma-1A-like isoform X1 n=1 Tax=Daphnia pulex TaxID=6669 RepID=UPI001EDD3F90|nr:centaurin-gamma-1A-like isoform X1 [Daphnia pulex]